MNAAQTKETRRGFVMTGGGAKGIYEAGVIHAFHLCGIEFDVITGSSIGAINALFYAEYQYRKKQLPAEVQSDPLKSLEALDPLVKAFQHAWWRLPEAGIVDDSEDGPLGRLKEDLVRTNVDLPLLVRLGWWWTDPHRWDVPPPRVWPHLVRLGRELLERLGDGSSLFKMLRRQKHDTVEAALRAYLARFGLEQSLVPATPNVLQEYFTQPFTPLHLSDILEDGEKAEGEGSRLIDPRRTLRDYHQKGIDLRLTRANYRTGRLELSAYTTLQEFVEYLESRDPTKPVIIGSSRVVVPGNPNAINAAIASGRFPGIFAPLPVTSIYPRPEDAGDEPENAFLYALLQGGLQAKSVRETLYDVYREMNPDMDAATLSYAWEHVYPLWDAVPLPRIDDAYIDGGAIDNTPSNSAVDAVREAIDRAGRSRRRHVLDLYVVFLHTEPNPGLLDIYDNPALHQIVTRTLKIQGTAKMTSDAGVVQTINRFGQRGEELGRQSQLLLQSVRETLRQIQDALPQDLDREQKEAVLEALRHKLYEQLQEQAAGHGFTQFDAEDLEAALNTLDSHSRDLMARRLPLHVEPVEIYPDEMQLETLHFTERLGFRREKAVEGMTMGCYNTLWRLRKHLEEKEAMVVLDKVDRQALELARKWMGIAEWPRSEQELKRLQDSWQCRRSECVFHAMHCRHGKGAGRLVNVQVTPAAGR